ncbi:MAG: hypothetical protein AAFW75_25295 [Cyanobacteria bacterium J06636_16]
MKSRTRIWMGIWMFVLSGGAIALQSAPVIAQSCALKSLDAPNPELRAFRDTTLGLSLGIPVNYRTMLRSSGHVTFHNPSSFEFIQCLSSTGQYGEVPPYVSLEIYEAVIPDSDLVQIVRRKRPWVDYYNPEYSLIEISGHPALQYEYTNEIYQTPIANISFLSGNGQTLITLSGPAQDPVLANALSTLEIYPHLP